MEKERALVSEPKEPRNGKVRPLNLALQGGGVHGAFTWGVLDRLLEEDLIGIGDIGSEI